MRSYLNWLRETYLADEETMARFLFTLKSNFKMWRDGFRREGLACHGRVAETVAWLQTGMNLLLVFLTEKNALDHEVAISISEAFREKLYELAQKQAVSIAEDRPAARFVRKLLGMLESEQVCVLPRNTTAACLPSSCIGYEDETFWYLFSDLMHKAVREQCERQGESFTISCKELLKALAEEGCLDTSPGLNTKKVRVGGKMKRMVCIRKDRARALVGEPAGEESELAEADSTAQEVSQVAQEPGIPWPAS